MNRDTVADMGDGGRHTASDDRTNPLEATGPAVAARQIRVQVLGRPTIGDVPDDWRIRPQALEFLTYLVVRSGQAWRDEIIDDLMPEPHRRLAAQRLHTYTYHLRQTFVLLGGARTALRLKRHHYSLAKDAFDADLWTMRHAIADAATTTNPATKLAALRRAVAAYTGPLATGSGYLWIKSYRDAARSDYVAAVVALAERLDRDEALAVIAAAIRHHPDDAELIAATRRVDRHRH